MAERFRWGRDELEIYDYWGIKAQDERGIAIAAEQRGHMESPLAAARALLADGMEPALIMKYSGLSEAELQQL